MPSRRLLRWKSFWFGILLMVFLGWAWRDSMDRGTYLAPAPGRILFWNTDGCVCFNLLPEDFEHRMGVSSIEGQSDTVFPEILSYSTDE